MKIADNKNSVNAIAVTKVHCFELTMISREDVRDDVQLTTSGSRQAASFIIPIEHVDTTKPQRPSVTDFEQQIDVLSGDPIVLFIDTEQYNKCRIWRSLLCCLKTDKSTTSFLKFELPRKPICAYLILIHIEKYKTFGAFSRFWIQFAIVFPLILQFIVSWFLFGSAAVLIQDENTVNDWNYLNITATVLLLLFFTEKIMFATTLIQLICYRDDDGKHKFGNIHSCMYFIVQFLVLGFLYQTAIALVILTSDSFDKIQVGIGIFFLLELDEWVYAVFIEPLVILDEDMFSVYFQVYGTLQNGHDVRLRANIWVLVYYLLLTVFSFLHAYRMVE